MELEEAKKVLMSLPQYQDLVSKECEAIDTVIHELVALQDLVDEMREEIEELQKENWRQKIKKKIQQLKIEEKTRLKGKGCFDRCLILSEYQYKENVLQELLKGE